MRFLYEYKTSENQRRSGEIAAPSRSAVYVQLKKQGIKPYKVDLAPGFGNWLLSLGKRTYAIVVLCLVCIVLCVMVKTFREENTSLQTLNSSFETKTRHQVIGDAAIIEKGIRNGWADVFPEEGERFLASFAIPGVPAGQRNTTEEEMKAALSRRIMPTEGDGIEARQIKSMVEGMKEELRDYLSTGGSIVKFGKRLIIRQEEEIGYYGRIKSELESAKESGMTGAALEELWEKRNAKLRNMGIKLVPMPE